eukprot:m.31535 g.31535  ORF g.31535 m.31535 type:complete len:425 (+) comp9704_c0_seq1:100-1374(+)
MTVKGFSNPKTTHFEFGGPIGAPVVMLLLPAVVYMLFFMCNKDKGDCSPFTFPDLTALTWSDLFDLNALFVYIGWFAFQALLYVVVPGPICKGLPLRNGDVLNYKCNGMAAFYISVVSVLGGHLLGLFDISYLYTHYLHLTTASILFSSALSVFVFLRAKRPGVMLALGGNSGNALYDFFIGHELNPRIGDFDIKFFCELRPGLIGWAVLTFGMAAQQFKESGEVTIALLLVSLFETYYVWDAFNSESSLMSTMDITTDGFGHMLSFGDLAWVPFTYTLQTRFLVDFPIRLSPLFIVFVIACQFTGYWIFRSANSQKDLFKRNPHHPSFADVETIQTQRGTRLLASGWWGKSRHINYFGDIIMALAWCLPCGFSSPLPYFYVIYFSILLIHRERRDDHKCHNKYGKDWEKYCEKVPYRIIPYVY